jgi:hypothetical protein
MVTRRDIIDLVISRATHDSFTGDERDGEAPPITFQNFTTESFRLGARELRARLSRLPATDLADELEATLDLREERRAWISQKLARERRERQAERGRKHGLQPAILAAARHFCKVRGRKMYAVEAWNAIKKEPYQISDGETVMIEGDAEKQMMFVQTSGGKQKRSRIKIAQWQKRYWVAAKPSSSKPG